MNCKGKREIKNFNYLIIYFLVTKKKNEVPGPNRGGNKILVRGDSGLTSQELLRSKKEKTYHREKGKDRPFCRELTGKGGALFTAVGKRG